MPLPMTTTAQRGRSACPRRSTRPGDVYHPAQSREGRLALSRLALQIAIGSSARRSRLHRQTSPRPARLGDLPKGIARAVPPGALIEDVGVPLLGEGCGRLERAPARLATDDDLGLRLERGSHDLGEFGVLRHPTRAREEDRHVHRAIRVPLLELLLSPNIDVRVTLLELYVRFLGTDAFV